MTWFMMPLEPSDTMRPTNTLTPLKTSESLPGRCRYDTMSAKTQSSATTIRRVGWAVSA